MFDMQVKLTSIFSIISTIFITLAVFVSGTVFWVILTTVLVQIIIQGYYSMMLVRKYIDNKKISKKDIAFGKRTSISLAINNIAMRIDSLIMAFFLGFEKLAIYTIITILPNQLKTLSNSFTPLILPKMTMHKNLKRRDIISYYWKLLLYTIGVIIIYSLLSPIVFKLFYPKYYSFVWLSIIFNISFISFANTIFNVDFIRLNKDKIINKINVISSGYLIVGSFIFIYFFGLIGAIINRMVFRGITMLLNLYYNKKCYAK